jgi:PLP dependent protein
MTETASRLSWVRDRIGAACQRVGRPPADVTLVAVTKGFSADIVREALDAGATDLGENRAQELREKAIAFPAFDRWHFIGHLQTNKARLVVGSVALIHSVDRLALAEEISRRASTSGLTQDVLIEVNVSGEPSKHGVEPARAPSVAVSVAELPGVRVLGLMTMAPLSADPEASRPFFADLKALSDRIRVDLPEARQLSMGMTRDFEIGVEEGATMVRVGEAIFGPRKAR